MGYTRMSWIIKDKTAGETIALLTYNPFILLCKMVDCKSSTAFVIRDFQNLSHKRYDNPSDHYVQYHTK